MKDNLVKKDGRSCWCKQSLNDSIAKSFTHSLNREEPFL